jgi:hypothetical protein
METHTALVLPGRTTRAIELQCGRRLLRDGASFHDKDSNERHDIRVRRKDLVTALENEESIVSAEFCPLRYHLMLVRYDRDISSSQDVLGSVKAQNYNARLIGSV